MWHIMREVTRRETHKANQVDVSDGPSEEDAHHLPITVYIPVTVEVTEGGIGSTNQADTGNAYDGEDARKALDTTFEAFYDDTLSLEELDIIAGVVKVYTGTHRGCTAVDRTDPR